MALKWDYSRWKGVHELEASSPISRRGVDGEGGGETPWSRFLYICIRSDSIDICIEMELEIDEVTLLQNVIAEKNNRDIVLAEFSWHWLSVTSLTVGTRCNEVVVRDYFFERAACYEAATAKGESFENEGIFHEALRPLTETESSKVQKMTGVEIPAETESPEVQKMTGVEIPEEVEELIDKPVDETADEATKEAIEELDVGI
ncbi:hypothetical protein LXL04_037805 [Taraxacum kok-saghyz]